MIDLTADVVVLGTGFGGSLTALFLQRVGLRPVLIDRGSHPRFAIGESSTPVADFVLRDLSKTYDLPRLHPLTRYGSWQGTYPQLTCGLKRGFSYFHHRPGRPFVPRTDHGNELLVAASSDDPHSDTHWLRSDVDGFFAGEAESAGIPYLDQTHVEIVPDRDGWRLTGRRNEEPVRVAARFLIDATGPARAVLRALDIPHTTRSLKTNSRALFAHFAGVEPWQDFLVSRNALVDDHPFPCDHAAQHHLLDEGWMWQLRFNNGITSAGFVLDAAEFPLDPSVSADEEWQRLLERYPSLTGRFRTAEILQPPEGLRRTGRMQRLAARMAGENWVLLPHTAGFIDPLHSSGIAQTMCGIERLVRLLAENWDRSTLPAQLGRYEQTLRAEFALIDDLVAGCYRARRDFRLFVAFSMFYFAAATTYEHRRLENRLPPGAAFLCADDPDFRRTVSEFEGRIRELTARPTLDEEALSDFERSVARAIEPYNVAGLCDPSAQNMYRYTAVPAS